jgi:hypothetical protein
MAFNFEEGVWGYIPYYIAAFILITPFLQVNLTMRVIIDERKIVRTFWFLFKKYERIYVLKDLIGIHYSFVPILDGSGLEGLFKKPFQNLTKVVFLDFEPSTYNKVWQWSFGDLLLGWPMTNTSNFIQFIVDKKPDIEVDEKIIKRYKVKVRS